MKLINLGITPVEAASAPQAQTEPEQEEQLRRAMLEAGVKPPEAIVFDGRIHRFSTTDKKSDLSGWYIAFDDGVPAARFGDWRLGIDETWRAKLGRQLTPDEIAEQKARLEAAKAKRDAEEARRHAFAAKKAAEMWANAHVAPDDHPYLKRKGVRAHGMRMNEKAELLIPVFTPEGEIASLQIISANGEKRFLPGGRITGCFCVIGNLETSGPIFIAEGFATAASVHEATGRPCVVAFSAYNLTHVLGALRKIFKDEPVDLCIVADNDDSGVGEAQAKKAAADHCARYIMPPEPGDANDYVLAHGHQALKQLLMPEQQRHKKWLLHVSDILSDLSPPSWLIEGWLPSKALCMLHGPSGVGKTFVALDWALSIASGKPDWFGHEVIPGTVVYLCGEGYGGVKRRIAAWAAYHGVNAAELRLFVSAGATDFNTPQGYNLVLEHLEALPDKPVLTVIDTIARFFAGDENRASDARTMIAACDKLVERGCTVLLVHHTGWGEDAQNRGRGSSAWRAAVDVEIGVSPSKHGAGLALKQLKTKDSEPLPPTRCKLEQVIIPGLYDAKGNAVNSAVLVQCNDAEGAEGEEKTSAKKSANSHAQKLAEYLKVFEAAWVKSGKHVREGKPFLARCALIDHLITAMGYTPASAEVICRPSSPKMVHALLVAGIIEAYGEGPGKGWVVVDSAAASKMLLASKAGNQNNAPWARQ